MRQFFNGLTAALPIASGYIPVAITFGLIVRSFGLSPWDAALASLLVFAGAAQFLAVGMYGVAGVMTATAAVSITPETGGGAIVGLVGGWPPGAALVVVQIVTAGFLLNLRHLLMSSVIAHSVGTGHSFLRRSILAFGITDEVFGVASWRIAEGGTVPAPYLAGLELGAYSAWVAGTVIGSVAGEILPPGLRIAMGLALYALFAALLAGQFRAAPRSAVAAVAVAALTGGGVNLALRLGLAWPAGAAFPLAMIVGSAAAMAVPGEDAQ